MSATLSATDAEHILTLLDSGKKVEAIKAVRSLTGVGLVDAKDSVEGRFGDGCVVVLRDKRAALVEEYLTLIQAQSTVFERMLDLIEESDDV